MNGIYVAAADRVGMEGPVQWLGHSLIVGPDGWPMAQAGGEEEEILYAMVNLRTIKAKRRWTDQTHLVSDRRTDLYDEMLGSGLKAYRL
jgi:predicted amidohydrolase